MEALPRYSQMHNELLDQFTLTDVDELSKVLSQIKSPKLKLLVERDLNMARSKLVTRLVNESQFALARKNGGLTSKNSTATTSNSNQIQIQFIDEEIEIEEEDIDGYIRDNIRGFENKIRSIKSILTDHHESKIKEALLCCNGDEDRTIEALLSGTKLPPRPQIPKRKVKKVVKKKVKNSPAPQQNNTTPDIQPLLSDITLKENSGQVLQSLLSSRIVILKNEIDREKEKTKKYIDEVNKNKNTNGANFSNLQDLVDSSNDDGMKTNRLFLAGEYEAIENMEFRIFTFKPERTFANEVSHIHFRVAESEFHRMLVNKSSHRVTEVKYIVSPALINRFERRRAEMAFERKMKFRDLKPVMAFSGISDSSDDNILSIARDGFKTGPVYFTYNPNEANKFISPANKIILFLVLVPDRVDNFADFTVNDVELVLPYYIVHYTTSSYQQNVHQPAKGLHDEWQNFEHEAKADKFMDDVKKFYQQTLIQKDKETKLGPIDGNQIKSGTDLWFEKVYSKKAEKEGFILGADELPSAISNASFEFEVEEIEDEELVTPLSGSHQHFDDDVIDDDDDDIDLENLTEEERQLLAEAVDEEDEEMSESQL